MGHFIQILLSAYLIQTQAAMGSKIHRALHFIDSKALSVLR